MRDGTVVRIYGKPVSKKRHRVARTGNGVRSYSDQTEESKRFKQMLAKIYKGKVLTGPLEIDFLFLLPRPKSHYGTGRNSSTLKKSAPRYHVCKPDKDNLEKFALDCMEGIVFKNDSQVYSGTAEKRYGDDIPSYPETIIWIREIGDTK